MKIKKWNYYSFPKETKGFKKWREWKIKEEKIVDNTTKPPIYNTNTNHIYKRKKGKSQNEIDFKIDL